MNLVRQVLNSAIHAGRDGYRPDVDGLRAVAVGAVVLYHYFPNFLRSGFVGVDIFFVISGYLITRILIDDNLEKRWSYANFYKRRINRIFPALIIVLGANLVLSWIALIPSEYASSARSIFASAVFSANFAFWTEAGYFDAAAAAKPSLHLWSLAIEEQFYLVWPALTLVLFTMSRRKAMAWLTLMCALSFAVSEHASRTDPAAAYYNPLSRVFELVIGGLCAWVLRFERIEEPIRRGLGWTGCALLATGFLIADFRSPFPGWRALFPTVGSACLILAGPTATLAHRALSLRPVVFVGLISYPLYLWHWPVFVWARLLAMTDYLPALTRIGLILASMGLASVTYRVVERPIRKSNRPATALICLSVMAAIAALALAGWAGVIPGRQSDKGLTPIVAASRDWGYPGKNWTTEASFPDYRFYAKKGLGPGVTLFIGDSNLEQYAPRVDRLVGHDPRAGSVIFATKGGCPFSAPALALKKRDCAGKLAQIDRLVSRPDVTTIVLGQQWRGVLGDDPRPDGVAALEARLMSLPPGKRVFILTNMPSGRAFGPLSLVSGSRLGKLEGKAKPGLTAPRSDAAAALFGINAAIKAVAARRGATVIDPMDSLCSPAVCPVTDENGYPVYLDDTHLNATAASRRAVFIDQTLMPPDAIGRRIPPGNSSRAAAR